MNGRLRAQAGVSAIETMIYIVGSLLVVGMLASIMRNVNRGFMQGVQTVRMQKDAREAVNLMSREIRNAGLKQTFYETSPGNFLDTILTAAYLGAGDSSSFSFSDGGRYDGLSFRQTVLDPNGKPLGVDTVQYSVDSTRSMLRRKLNNGRFEDFCPNVDGLQFQYGVYAVNNAAINERPIAPGNWGTTGSAVSSFDGSALIVSLSSAGSGGVIQNAVAIDLASPKTYYCEIVSAGSEEFFANINSLDLVIFDNKGKILVTNPFLPGHSPLRRRLEFSVPDAKGCRLGFRMNAGGSAQLRITSVRFGELNLGAFSWKNAPSLLEKKCVRAVRILLMAKTTNPLSGQTGRDYTLANAVIPVSDRYMRRYYEEIVPVPNNGNF